MKQLNIQSKVHRTFKAIAESSHKNPTYDNLQMVQSMSRKGNCWDNTVAESIFKTLNTELILGYKQINKEQMRQMLFQYIEI